MKRDLQALTSREFDLAIIGGGIAGTAIAREASKQGLSTALVEQHDFCGATSANSLKIIHGGLRYLQQVNLARTRQSANARHDLLHSAPGIVDPLPCMMPTRGLLMKSKPALFMGLLLNDLLSFDRNAGLTKDKHIPPGRILSRQDCLKALPNVPEEGITGAATWHDAIARNTERLVIAMLHDAAHTGTVAANYLEVSSFLGTQDSVTGVAVKDQQTGNTFDIRARLVVNAAGPWTNVLLKRQPAIRRAPLPGLALAVNLVLKRPWISSMAAGLSFTDDTGNRLLFFCPWRNQTLVGTYYRSHLGDPGKIQVSEEDIALFLQDINRALPAEKISANDIAMIHAGLLPTRNPTQQGKRDPALLEHPLIIDHAASDNVDGLVSVVGNKYTTACPVARIALRTISRKLGRPAGRQDANPTPLPDADAANSTETLAANIQRGLRDEMAQTLSDLLYRRTGLAASGTLDNDTLLKAADIVKTALGWDETRTTQEIEKVRRVTFPGSEFCR